MKKRHHSHEMGESWAIAAALKEGPGTKEDILNHFQVFIRRFGFFFTPFSFASRSGDPQRYVHFIEKKIEELKQKEWIRESKKADAWELTEKGRGEVNIMLAELSRSGKTIDRMLRPQAVSKATFILHLVLGALKLPAALISGSVALFNDALDTLVDAFSSIIVFLGFKTGKEKAAAWFLFLCMAGTGAFALYESVNRFLHPSEVGSDPFTITAIAVSAVLSGILYFYQKLAGLRAGSLTLLAQSMDSRNHLLVAVGVAASLLAAALGLPLLDLLIGALIAVIILKGAVELLIDLIKNRGDEEGIDLSQYGFRIFEKYRERQLKSWLLYLVEEEGVCTRAEIEDEARISIDFEKISQLKAIGLAESDGIKEKALQMVNHLFEEGCLEKEEGKESGEKGEIKVSEKGKSYLDRAMRKLDRHGSPSGQSGIPGRLAVVLSSGITLFLIYLLMHRASFLRATIIEGNTLPFHFLGGIIYLVGSFRFSSSRRDLGRRGKRSGKLVTEGIYRYLRHPMYGAFILRWVGAALFTASFPIVILSLVLSSVQIFSLMWEEKELRRQFESDWEKYRNQVQRKLLFLPEWLILLMGLVLFFLRLF